MKKLFSIMLAMLIFAFNATAGPANKAAIKKADLVYEGTCCLIPPAPDVNVPKAEFVKADILFFKDGDQMIGKDDIKAWERKSNLDPADDVALKEEAAANKKAKDIADDSSPGTNDAIDAKNNVDEKMPAIIPLK